MASNMPTVHLLDYVAGNVQSLVNAIDKLGYQVKWVKSAQDVPQAELLILPGVGHFGHCLAKLSAAGFLPAIRAHVAAGKPFLGICVGLQALFAGSAEDPSAAGLGLLPGSLVRFSSADKSVPHIGWNDAAPAPAPRRAGAPEEEDAAAATGMYGLGPSSKYYYVHSYMRPYVAGELESAGWRVATTTYGDETFVGAVARGRVLATQFHPEKSGEAGLRVIRAFLSGAATAGVPAPASAPPGRPGLTRRVIACLDVRANDSGDLVVTKGDRYDVRESDAGRGVRNLGKPVELARRYYDQGADEVAFLNITSFRDCPLVDQPMLEVLRRAAATVFVPLTVGGGIRATVDPATGREASALEVAALYFGSGADKVSIGSDAVVAAEEYLAAGGRMTGRTSIEQISAAYGSQAVVVSIDPRRVYLSAAEAAATSHAVAEMAPADRGPGGETLCWYACTVRGGRETRDLDVVQLATAAEALGAGEILLNCIDRDGTGAGFDLELVRQVKAAVRIPVVASSGAGCPAHFGDVFENTTADAALGAGIFHRGEHTVQQVKDHLRERGLAVRQCEGEASG